MARFAPFLPDGWRRTRLRSPCKVSPRAWLSGVGHCFWQCVCPGLRVSPLTSQNTFRLQPVDSLWSNRPVSGCLRRASRHTGRPPLPPAPFRIAGCGSATFGCLLPAPAQTDGLTSRERSRSVPGSPWSHSGSKLPECFHSAGRGFLFRAVRRLDPLFALRRDATPNGGSGELCLHSVPCSSLRRDRTGQHDPIFPRFPGTILRLFE